MEREVLYLAVGGLLLLSGINASALVSNDSPLVPPILITILLGMGLMAYGGARKTVKKFKQPSGEEKRHPAYIRYDKKMTLIVLSMPVIVLVSFLMGYYVGNYSGLLTLLLFVVVESITIGRSAEADRKEWQEWRRSRLQSSQSQSDSSPTAS